MIAADMIPGKIYRRTRSHGVGRYYTIPKQSTQTLYKALQRRERAGILKAYLISDLLDVRDKGWIFVWSHFRYRDDDNQIQNTRRLVSIDPNSKVRQVKSKPAPRNR